MTQSFYKITTPDETEEGYHYHDGLNTLIVKKSMKTLRKGFSFFSVDNLYYFYQRGFWIREVTVPTGVKVTQEGHQLRASQIILGEKHALFDLETLVSDEFCPFVMISPELIILTARYGYLKTLQTFYNYPSLKHHFQDQTLRNHLYLEASAHGQCHILDWLKKRHFRFKHLFYDHYQSIFPVNDLIMNLATVNGHSEVLEWWKTSGFQIKKKVFYDNTVIDKASQSGHVVTLQWWIKNREIFKIKMNPSKSIELASQYGHISILNWWCWSDLRFDYSPKAIDKASENGHIEVLDWWKNSGLPLRYSSVKISKLPYDSQSWWRNSNLSLKEKKSEHFGFGLAYIYWAFLCLCS